MSTPVVAPPGPPAGGLTSAEADARLKALGKREGPRTSRSYLEIVWSNTFTLFNLVLLILLVPMAILGLWKDMLFGGVLIANTLIGIVQETRAKRTLDRLALLVAPRARVVRDGSPTPLPVDRIVPGDLVLLEPGEQVVADGPVTGARGLSVDESILTGEADAIAKADGDRVLSGAYCVAGSGAYVVEAVGSESFAEKLAAEAKGTRTQLSPLQLDINRILKITIAIMVPMAALLISQVFWSDQDVVEQAQRIVAALVPLVPEGLVLLTSLTFAVAAVRLARLGTLAQQLNAVESLASVDTVCVDKTGTLTENRLELTGVEAADGGDPDAARAALSLLAASAGFRNGTMEAIATALPGDAGTVTAEVPFSSARKWSGVTVDGRGTIVLGAPEILERLGVAIPEGLSARIAAQQAERKRVVLLATGDAALEPVDQEGMGTLPPLTAAGAAVLEEGIRPDAADTVAFLRHEGVRVKVISGDGVGTVQAVAKACGVEGAEHAVAGPDLPTDPDALADAARENFVFGRITPEQKRELVKALTRSGHYVAMIGDGVNDVLALKEARLAVSMGNGSQMAKGVADLVLLSNAFSTLPRAIEAGRQIIRNTHRVAKLFVTKTVYAALILLMFGLAPIAFPFLPRQLSITSSLTIGIPAFFLALSRSEGPVRREGFMPSLLAFCVPAGFVVALGIATAYLLVRGPLDGSIEEGRTAAIMAATFLGLSVVVELERGFERKKLRPWVLWMVVGFAVALIGGVHVPFLRDFFEAALPTPAQWGVIAGVVVAGFGLLLAVRRIPFLHRIEARGS